MSKCLINVSKEDLINSYIELKSSYKVANKYNISPTVVKRLLKEYGVLRNQSDAAKQREFAPTVYKRTEWHKNNLSRIAKERCGEKHPCYGKPKSEETKKKISEKAQKRVGKANANYKHGNYKRRPRDFKLVEFKAIRKMTYERDNYTCVYCENMGGNLHAHHKIPYWVSEDAFLDIDNIVTVCEECHLNKAHLGNYNKFDITLIDETLMNKYKLDRERLSELASLWEDAIVRSPDIDETGESNRND